MIGAGFPGFRGEYLDSGEEVANIDQDKETFREEREVRGIGSGFEGEGSRPMFGKEWTVFELLE